MNNKIGLSFVAALAVAACDSAPTDAQPAPGSVQTDVSDDHTTSAVSGQTFSATQDFGGYYLPLDEVAIGDIRLDHISMGLDWEFAEYQADPENGFLPMGLHFDDTSSPTGIGELGNTYYEVTHDLQPSAYQVTDEGLVMSGTHDLLGDFHFEGRWNLEEVRQMQDGYPENAQSALTGTLTIGDVVFEDVVFQGWLGD
ncbi:MAG: hypothetical protein DHS20C06_14970 [Hyphobacterium sp.]|nr:MAG: hypothetical protein DHS20C06_14970 [Hyphobacterium sp.]